MVYFFEVTYESTSEQYPEPQSFDLFMGKNQNENELLIKYGHPEDVWFHVDDLSSAHVYLRMKPGMALDDLPQEAILDCSTLVKANSIAGCKVRTHITITTIHEMRGTRSSTNSHDDNFVFRTKL